MSPAQHGLSVLRVSGARKADGLSVLASVLLAASCCLFGVLSSPQLAHWFLLPLFACGAVIGVDLIDWLRGRMDLFDPAGMVGILGFHFFFLSPMLMIHWAYRMRYLPEQPDDYRVWLGLMAILNLIGLVGYRWVVAWRTKPAGALPVSSTRWEMEGKRFWIVWAFLAIASVLTEGYLLVSFGGFSGYVAAYSGWLKGNSDSFAGSALLFAVSESLPILLILAFAFWARKAKPGTLTVVVVFTIFAVADLIIGGMRGSRSNVIWTVFWGAGIIHLYVRRIPRAAALASLAFLYLFVSVYAAYKQHGSSLFADYEISGEVSSLNTDAEDSATVLVGDFSRTDVQANLLWRMSREGHAAYAWGGSYLGALTMLVPKSLWPERPPTLVRWATDAEYGSGTYASGMMQSTRVYGISGEAMMNFGPLGVPLSLVLLGFGVGALRRLRNTLASSDARLLLLPFLVNLIFLTLLNDSDNIVFYLIKYGLVPVLLLVLSSQRLARRVMPCKLQSQPSQAVNPAFNSTSTVPLASM
jgi:hypothetical protein